MPADRERHLGIRLFPPIRRHDPMPSSGVTVRAFVLRLTWTASVWLALVGGLAACRTGGGPAAISTFAPGVAVPRQITLNPADDFAPSWSRDGRFLVFVSAQQGGWNLWTVDLAAPTPRALTMGQFQYTNPFVAPDGHWIAVASDRGSATRAWSDLWRLSLDGTQEQRLISASPMVKEFVPALSSDGHWLAYLDLPMDRPPQYRLMLVELPGGLPRMLTEDHVVFSPIRFSPDNQSILYTADTLGSSDVWTIGVTGAGARALTTRRDAETAGDFSPDGATIVFVSNQSGTDELWLMDAQGLGARQLTYDLATASLPAFSPNGALIAYTSTKSGNQDIWVIGSGINRRP
jgi:Tol biopolymer transport system component